MRIKRLKTRSGEQSKPNELGILLTDILKKVAIALAFRLGRAEKTLSNRQKIAIVSLICLGMATYSMSLFYRGIFNQSNAPIISLKTKHITPLRNPQLPDSILYKKYLNSQHSIDSSPVRIDSLTK